jgi:Eco57I restriction-modification methylase/MmeI, target recognition domain/MmeI, N-terminal domain
VSIARHHAEWLSLVPVSGPFLSLPVLMEAFNTGLEPHDPDLSRLLRQEYANWQESFEKRKADPAPHQHWIKFVLTKTLELDERVLAEGQKIPQTLQAEIPEHHELLQPSIVVIDPTTMKPRLLVQTYPRSQELTSYVVNSRWKASPDTRMTELLHATGVRLGLVTNGEHWMLVDAPKGETTGYSSWYASLWLEEPITLRAFRGLLSASRFFNVPDDQTLEALFIKSASNQQEVTDQLGYQVRRAVEVLIHSLDRADQDFGRELLAGVREEVLYEAALTVMMRLVFLFCAEERELIPSKPFPVYEQNYSVSTISKQLRELADQHGEELLERRYDAWPRLLAAFRAVYGGLRHDEVHIPAYGGNLFNPDRFPFLEGRKRGTSWRDTEANPLPVNNRTVLHLLEALQLLQIKVPGGGPAEARRLSFRALDIEQIGHVYEGLLDHTAKRAAEPFLGLAGTREKEPELPLAELEKLLAKAEADLVTFLKEETGKSENAIKKSLKVELDAQDAARFRTACQSDDALLKRVKPLAGLVRLDNFGYPVVIPKGSVFVTAGTDRRSSGTHYTPRSLTEPIVQYTLEPLVYVGPAEGKPKNEWKLKSAKELLGLKICDMACGSGAFLVQAARYMAERLMEAWDEAKKAHPNTPGITPEGTPSTAKANEALIPDEPAERKTYAMRIIAQRCLYGVDKNPLAVEMAKLSLWLLTLAKDKPFEFLDHSIRWGDSLVGLHDIAQLRHFSLKPDADDAVLFKGPLDSAVDEAITLRLKLEDLPANTVEDVERQEKLLKEANEKIARLRSAADLLVAAEFWADSPKDKLEKIRHAAVVSGYYVEKGPSDEFEEKAAKERRSQLMYHWPLEFPEVIVKRGGFDAFVGNPPFMGGSKIATEYGVSYRDHLVDVIAEGRRGQRGQADLCSYFFCRLATVVRPSGHFGVLATNTISQGDTRVAGLDYLIASGLVIYRAIASQRWPGTANLEVASVWIGRRTWAGPSLLDEKEVDSITSLLTPAGQITGTPHRLKSNANHSFEGSRIEGTGFVLSPDLAKSLIATNPRNGEVLCPFLRGEDFLNRPDQSPAYVVINFQTWPLNRESAPSGYVGPVAADFPDCLSIVERDVKPQRLALPPTIAINITTAANWWRYRDVCPALHAALAETQVERVLFHPFTSKHVAFAFVTRDCVFAAPHNVFVFDDWGHFAVLQSSLHIVWAYTYCSTLETRLRYTRSSIFETFAFPQSFSGLEAVGRTYHESRATVMLQRNEGLTQTYNGLHNAAESSADIQRIRDLHVEMDYAVAAAYGWTDLKLDHGFHQTKQGVRFTISEPSRREVLQRLLKLNHQRHAEEEKQGLHGKSKSKKPAATAKPKKGASKPGVSTSSLFDLDDSIAFPNTDRDKFLCGLVCDLVAAEPGLSSTAYLDSLVVALGYQRHQRLLAGKDRAAFAALCKAIPAASGTAAQQIPWSDLKSVLGLRKAIVLDSQAIRRGPELDDVRKSYPTTDPSLIALIQKAAAELRDLQAQAQPATPEKAAILRDFVEDRKQMCGVAA